MCDVLPSRWGRGGGGGADGSDPPSVSVVLDPPPPSLRRPPYYAPRYYRPGDTVSGAARVERGSVLPAAGGGGGGAAGAAVEVKIEVVGEEIAVSYDAATVGEYRRSGRREVCRGAAAVELSPASSSSPSSPREVLLPFRFVLPAGVDSGGGLPGSTGGRVTSRLHPESYCEVRYFVRASVVARVDASGGGSGTTAAAGCGVGDLLLGRSGGGGAVAAAERTFDVVPATPDEEEDEVGGGTGGGVWVDASPSQSTGAACCIDSPLGPTGNADNRNNSRGGEGGTTPRLLGLRVGPSTLVPGQTVRVGVAFVDSARDGRSRVRAALVRIEQRTAWAAGGRAEGRTDVLAEAWLDLLAATSVAAGGSPDPTSGAGDDTCQEPHKLAECSLAVPSSSKYTRRGGLVAVTHVLRASLELEPEGLFCGRSPEAAVPLRIVAAPGRSDAADGSGDGAPKSGGAADGGGGAIHVEVCSTSERGGARRGPAVGEEGRRAGGSSVHYVLTACCSGGY